MNEQPALFIGIDWADQKHDIYVIDRNDKGFHQELKHSAEHIDAWVGEMLELGRWPDPREIEIYIRNVWHWKSRAQVWIGELTRSFCWNRTLTYLVLRLFRGQTSLSR